MFQRQMFTFHDERNFANKILNGRHTCNDESQSLLFPGRSMDTSNEFIGQTKVCDTTVVLFGAARGANAMIQPKNFQTLPTSSGFRHHCIR